MYEGEFTKDARGIARIGQPAMLATLKGHAKVREHIAQFDPLARDKFKILNSKNEHKWFALSFRVFTFRRLIHS